MTISSTFVWNEYRDMRKLARALGETMPTLRTRVRRGEVVPLGKGVYGVRIRGE